MPRVRGQKDKARSPSEKLKVILCIVILNLFLFLNSYNIIQRVLYNFHFDTISIPNFGLFPSPLLSSFSSSISLQQVQRKRSLLLLLPITTIVKPRASSSGVVIATTTSRVSQSTFYPAVSLSFQKVKPQVRLYRNTPSFGAFNRSGKEINYSFTCRYNCCRRQKQIDCSLLFAFQNFQNFRDLSIKQQVIGLVDSWKIKSDQSQSHKRKLLIKQNLSFWEKGGIPKPCKLYFNKLVSISNQNQIKYKNYNIEMSRKRSATSSSSNDSVPEKSKEPNQKESLTSLENKTVVELKRMLSEIKKPVSGKKAELIQRYLEATSSSEGEGVSLMTMEVAVVEQEGEKDEEEEDSNGKSKKKRKLLKGAFDTKGETVVEAKSSPSTSSKKAKTNAKIPASKSKSAKAEGKKPTTTTKATKAIMTTSTSTAATTMAALLNRFPNREIFPRTPTPMKEYDRSQLSAKGLGSIRVISWNVAGLRGLLNKAGGPACLQSFTEKYDPHLLFLQEHKLQETHVPDIESSLKELLPHYHSYWTCSTGKKGYSGVVTLVHDSIKESILTIQDATNMLAENDEARNEGRLLAVELPQAVFVNSYVPNSGEKLQRLDYRTKQWDNILAANLKSLETTKEKPVILGGDLNVAYDDKDFFNPQEKRMEKAAGTTPEERASFRSWSSENDFVDSFRHFHPTAMHVYSYWSMRAGNRPFNRGLRLDYFIVSRSLLGETSTQIQNSSFDSSVAPSLNLDHLSTSVKARANNIKNNVNMNKAGVTLVDSYALDEEEITTGMSDHGPVGIDLFFSKP